jgi:hypothetical protein
MKNKVFLMTKTPIHGLIKTKLSADIGNCESKRFTLLNIENVKKILNNKKKFQLYFYTTPIKKFRSYSYTYNKNVLLQKGSSLGKKIWYLRALIKDTFILIGSDIPDINFADLYYAFEVLKTRDIVIGPTFDGGFWLIGFSNKKSIKYPFQGIRWSSKYTLKDLIKNIEKNGNSINFCKKLRDIDIMDDYCDYINKV